jgi:Methyltransferase domain
MSEVASALQDIASGELELLRASKAFDDPDSDLAKRHHFVAATSQVKIPGLWLEFGVSVGTSTAVLAECAKAASSRLYGFDSFEGLPEEWVVSDNETLPRGSFGGRPSGLPDNVELVTGMFQDTMPEFLTTHTDRVAFAHVDCDLYSSAKCVLTSIQERLTIGSVLIFDELFNYDRYFEHEMRALVELGREGLRWRYVGHVPARCTASLIITGVGSMGEA